MLVLQLLETSGVADVEPLAALLTSSGFKLSGVVAVVDAEAGSSQLQHEEVALAQVCTARQVHVYAAPGHDPGGGPGDRMHVIFTLSTASHCWNAHPLAHTMVCHVSHPLVLLPAL